MQHGLDRGDGIDLWDTSWGTQLDRGDGIDLRGHAIGVWHWLGHVMGARLDQRDGIDLRGHDMGCDTGWMWMMRLIYGGIPMGRTTGSGRWNWIVEANHGGAWHWLDLGEGIDLCGRVMRARDTGWIGLWKWFMGACRMTKYYMVAEFELGYHVSYVWR